MKKEAWPWSRETGTWRDEGQDRGHGSSWDASGQFGESVPFLTTPLSSSRLALVGR